MLTVRYDQLGLRAGDRLLDLGCGGGRHAFEALRRGAVVTALDLDDAELKDVAILFAAMTEAGEARAGASGTVVNGSAVDLPFPEGSFDRIIAAEVLEHIPADAAAIKELARVLRPGARLCVHSGFSGQMHDHVWYRYFVRAREVDDLVFPRLDEVIAQFAEAGLAYVALDQVDQQVAASLPAYFERFRHRSFSTLQHMSEDEIATGMAAMQEAARQAEGMPPEPVIQTADLLVLERVDA
jgi:cyclopropane fatty-acyl-phospholipid synthase-like methyltransferase